MQTFTDFTVMATGRIVWTVGDLFKGRPKTEFNSNTPKRNEAGEIMQEYGFGLAVPKTELGQPGGIWEVLHQAAWQLFPNRQIPPGFAMKYKDGDTVDEKGIPFAQREGYAGHIVIACTTSLPIKYFKFENGANIMINEGIKCGDYVKVQLQVKAHAAMGQGKAGLYVNPMAVQLLGFGKEIINTPSGDQIFGTAAPAMPQGASAIPVGQPGQIIPSAPGQAMVPGAPQMPGMPQAAPTYQPPAPVAPQPHYGVVPPQFQPPPGGQPIAQPAAPGYPQPGNAPMPVGTTPMAPTAQPHGVPPGYQPQPMPGYGNATPPSAPAMPAMPGVPGYPQR